MPHETDASALVWLVWMVWIYWGIRSWLKQPSAGEGTENHRHETMPNARMSLTATIAGLPEAGSEAERVVAPGRRIGFRSAGTTHDQQRGQQPRGPRPAADGLVGEWASVGDKRSSVDALDDHRSSLAFT